MSISIEDVRTPVRKPSLIGSLLSGRRFPHWAAKLALRIAKRRGRPLRFGKRVIAVRHQDVTEMLSRDLDFHVAPVNQHRIEEVNGGPFVLGMDRSETLLHERRALYSALADVDLANLQSETLSDAKQRLTGLSAGADAIGDFARPVAASTAARLFGIGSGDDALFAECVRAVFAHTFLNLGDDEAIRDRALIAGQMMGTWFEDEIARRRKDGELGSDFMGQLLRQARLDDDGVRRTLGGMLVGSIDTTASSFAKIFCVISSDPVLKKRIAKRWSAGRDIYGLCLEALRLRPHNPIVMRQAAVDTKIGKTRAKKGDAVIAWTQAAMLDPAAFPDPDRMVTDRTRASYLHFGAGLHPCAGRAINQFQIPILIGLLLDAGAERAGKLQYAGPFPSILPVRFPAETKQ